MNMQTEPMREKCNEYVGYVRGIQELTTRFNNVDRSFSSWSGPTRREIQARLKSEEPAFQTLIDVTLSYPETATQAANQADDLETRLTRLLQ
jgi:hypothetical protein